MVEQKLNKNARWLSEKKMQDGRAKKCKMVEQKLNEKCDWKNARCRAKKCEMVEHKLNKKCKTAGQKNLRWPS
jgi:hypothetical protein